MLVVSQAEFKRLDHSAGVLNRLHGEHKRIREFHNQRRTIAPECVREEMKRWGIGNMKSADILDGKVNPETIRRWKISKGQPGHRPCPAWVFVMLKLKIENPGLAEKMAIVAKKLNLTQGEFYKKFISGEISTGIFDNNQSVGL